MSDRRKHSLNPNRRTVLKAAGAAGLAAASPWATGAVEAEDGTTTLDIPQWEDPLPIPGVLSPTRRMGGTAFYDVTLSEFEQNVLPDSMYDDPAISTTVWGYNGSYPGPTIEAMHGKPAEVTYHNELPTGTENHLLSDAVDPRVHGAPGHYTDPDDPVNQARTVTHLHGGVVEDVNDGYPMAWADSEGQTIEDFTDGENPVPYQQTKTYPNEQEPATLWYHDHALGITRLNVYAGLAGFYFVRDKRENGLPSGPYEVPIVIQDRSFNDDGSLQYPPEFVPEFFGDVPVVNGKAYPFLDVEPRSYRFRFLNGSNNRVFNLKLRNEDPEAGADPYDDVPMMEQFGTDLGFLDTVTTIGPTADDDVDSMLMGGAERFDVVVDFSGFKGETFTLVNGAPTPYAGDPFTLDPDNLPEIMQFRVGTEVTTPDESIPPQKFLDLMGKKYPSEPLSPSGDPKYMTLDSREDEGLDSHFLKNTGFDDATVENGAIEVVDEGTAEEWVLANTTPDSHPIHMHLVDFSVVSRQPFDADGFNAARDAGESPVVDGYLTGTPSPPAPTEQGPKDTVLVNNGEAVTIRPEFTGFAGHYVWHCHILEHEDQEMMLPYIVE